MSFCQSALAEAWILVFAELDDEFLAAMKPTQADLEV